MINIFKKITLAMGVFALMLFSFVSFEPQSALAVTDEVVVTQTVTSGISISNPSDISMSRALTVTDHKAIGTVAWGVTTNNDAGYTLSVNANTLSACGHKVLCDSSSGDAFTDIATSTTALWSSPSNDYVFGFSAFGSRVNTATYGTGSDCGSGHVPNTGLKYRGLASSTVSQIASHTSTSGFSGDTTTVCFAAEQNGVFAPSGNYTASIVATAVTQ